MFCLKDNDQISDIGGGSNPFSKATVVTEPYLEMNTHRSGLDIKPGMDYVTCFAEKLLLRISSLTLQWRGKCLSM